MTVPQRQSNIQENIKPWLRTPLKYSVGLSQAAGCQVYLKLDNLQPGGSFKSRGVGNYLLAKLNRAGAVPASNGHGSAINGHDAATNGHSDATMDYAERTHFYSSSGGNAGLACVTAAVSLNVPATVVVPLSTTPYMIEKIKEAGAAAVIQEGASWAEADAHLHNVVFPEARSRGERPVYVPPFDHPAIWAGHSTLVPEALAQLQALESDDSIQPDAFVCSVGGGGLFCGIMEGLEARSMLDTPVVAVETKGADSLAYSLEAGELKTLPAITSIATTLGARTVARQAFELAHRNENVTSVVLDDTEAMLGCVQLADAERILVEASCGVSIAMCYNGNLKRALPHLTKDSKVIIVCCGGVNVSIDLLTKYRKEIESKK